jgi:periplasmic copper chaperone A
MRLALALILVLLLPGTALAHVTVLPESSRPGETADLTFRVPNERDDAATVQVDVFLPKGVPAKVSSPEGWTQVVLDTGEVRWTADADKAINPGRTQDFKVRLGPLPNAPRIVFKALQHYADGQVVRWIQDPSDEQRPAAVLDLGGKVSLEGDVNRPDQPSDHTGLAIAIAVGFFGTLALLAFLVWRWKV